MLHVRLKVVSNKTPEVTKSVNIDIWVVGTSLLEVLI